MAGSQIIAIVNSLATTLDAVTGVQRVYKYEIAVLQAGNIPTILGGSQAVDYWTIRPESTEPVRFAGYQMELNHIVTFRHYYTIGDASVTEPLLDVIIVAVFDRFSTVFAIAPQAEVTGPLVIEWPVPRMIGETFLVWLTTYRLPVRELIVVQ